MSMYIMKEKEYNMLIAHQQINDNLQHKGLIVTFRQLSSAKQLPISI